MADISKIKTPNGTTYNLKDSSAIHTVDTALSSTSTNPVQNKVVHTQIARLVDAGGKNLLKNTAQTQTIGGVTFTMNSDGSITANGTKTNNDWLILSTGNSLKAESYVLTSGGVSGSETGMLVVVSTSDSLGSAIMTTSTTSGIYERELTEDYTGLYFAIRIASGTVCDNVVFKPMLCIAEDYAISSEFVPYVPKILKIWTTTDGTDTVLHLETQ